MKLETIERRRNFVISTFYFVILIGAFYLFMKYAFWLFSPFIFALLVAAVLQKPIRKITERFSFLKRGMLSAVFVLLFVLLVVTLLAVVGVKLANELQNFGSYLMTYLEDLPNTIKLIEQNIVRNMKFLPDSLETAAKTALEGFSDTLLAQVSGEEGVPDKGGSLSMSWIATPLSGIWTTAKQIPSIIIAVVVAIIASIFMTAEFPMLMAFVRRQIPQKKQPVLDATKRIVSSALAKLGKSYVTLIAITFAEVTIGLFILYLAGLFDSQYIIAIAAIIAVVDILPVLGTGTILLPWGVFSLLTDKIGLGIGILVLYAIITVLRQFIEPKLVAANLGLPSILTIMGMYLGLQLFGFIGLFLLPIVFILIKVLNDEGIIHVWRRGKVAQKEEKTDS